jgi:hypothetical protein
MISTEDTTYLWDIIVCFIVILYSRFLFGSVTLFNWHLQILAILSCMFIRQSCSISILCGYYLIIIITVEIVLIYFAWYLINIFNDILLGIILIVIILKILLFVDDLFMIYLLLELLAIVMIALLFNNDLLMIFGYLLLHLFTSVVFIWSYSEIYLVKLHSLLSLALISDTAFGYVNWCSFVFIILLFKFYIFPMNCWVFVYYLNLIDVVLLVVGLLSNLLLWSVFIILFSVIDVTYLLSALEYFLISGCMVSLFVYDEIDFRIFLGITFVFHCLIMFLYMLLFELDMWSIWLSYYISYSIGFLLFYSVFAIGLENLNVGNYKLVGIVWCNNIIVSLIICSVLIFVGLPISFVFVGKFILFQILRLSFGLLFLTLGFAIIVTLFYYLRFLRLLLFSTALRSKIWFQWQATHVLFRVLTILSSLCLLGI